MTNLAAAAGGKRRRLLNPGWGSWSFERAGDRRAQRTPQESCRAPRACSARSRVATRVRFGSGCSRTGRNRGAVRWWDACGFRRGRREERLLPRACATGSGYWPQVVRFRAARHWSLVGTPAANFGAFSSHHFCLGGVGRMSWSRAYRWCSWSWPRTRPWPGRPTSGWSWSSRWCTVRLNLLRLTCTESGGTRRCIAPRSPLPWSWSWTGFPRPGARGYGWPPGPRCRGRPGSRPGPWPSAAARSGPGTTSGGRRTEPAPCGGWWAGCGWAWAGTWSWSSWAVPSVWRWSVSLLAAE